MMTLSHALQAIDLLFGVSLEVPVDFIFDFKHVLVKPWLVETVGGQQNPHQNTTTTHTHTQRREREEDVSLLESRHPHTRMGIFFTTSDPVPSSWCSRFRRSRDSRGSVELVKSFLRLKKER